jgi:DNA-binding PadR family transcriptional regulator
VSPIFRHGRLRLYLLKLLDEAPRHGYEVIRLLQDRFMGVYSPSPGTIYPRLARLEDDGLVTHDDVDGRKVYRITEKGREEIRGRLDDLAELEEELTESVRDIAREVSEDVRDTVRNLREEITWAARDVRRDGRGARDGRADESGPGAGAGAGPDLDGEAAGSDGSDGSDDRAAASASAGVGAGPADDARRIREEARQARDDIRDAFRSRRDGGARDGSRPGGARPGGARAGGAAPGSGARSGGGRSGARSGGGRPDWAGFAGKGGGWTGLPAGLDRLASDFARDLSHVAGHAGDLGEGALGDLKGILADALTRIRDEVFAPGGEETGTGTAPADAGGGASPADATAAPDTTATDTAGADTAGADTAGADTAGADTAVADEGRPDDGAWAAGTREAEAQDAAARESSVSDPENPGAPAG